MPNTIQPREYSTGSGTDDAPYANRDSRDNLYVRYLYFNDGRWNSNYNWLSNDWNSNNPAALLAILFVSPPQLRVSNIIALHRDLVSKTYRSAPYEAFNISDPKPRSIHKANVRDRLLHRAIYRILYPFFDTIFIPDSYSCREKKGTHKALNRFREFGWIVSRNNTRACWILKCDVKKFFASIDHEVLLKILQKYISDADILWILEKVISSFYSARKGIGLPLGNLTSQLFVNIYMNEFDQFMKHHLKAKYYIRYVDDFVVLSENHAWLEAVIEEIQNFLEVRLKLSLHPDKVFIKTLASGVDFLGWAHFPDHRVLCTTTKWRMMKRLASAESEATLQSYLGLLSHGNTYKIREQIN